MAGALHSRHVTLALAFLALCVWVVYALYVAKHLQRYRSPLQKLAIRATFFVPVLATAGVVLFAFSHTVLAPVLAFSAIFLAGGYSLVCILYSYLAPIGGPAAVKSVYRLRWAQRVAAARTRRRARIMLTEADDTAGPSAASTASSPAATEPTTAGASGAATATGDKARGKASSSSWHGAAAFTALSPATILAPYPPPSHDDDTDSSAHSGSSDNDDGDEGEGDGKGSLSKRSNRRRRGARAGISAHAVPPLSSLWHDIDSASEAEAEAEAALTAASVLAQRRATARANARKGGAIAYLNDSVFDSDDESRPASLAGGADGSGSTVAAGSVEAAFGIAPAAAALSGDGDGGSSRARSVSGRRGVCGSVLGGIIAVVRLCTWRGASNSLGFGSGGSSGRRRGAAGAGYRGVSSHGAGYDYDDDDADAAYDQVTAADADHFSSTSAAARSSYGSVYGVGGQSMSAPSSSSLPAAAAALLVRTPALATGAAPLALLLGQDTRPRRRLHAIDIAAWGLPTPSSSTDAAAGTAKAGAGGKGLGSVPPVPRVKRARGGHGVRCCFLRRDPGSRRRCVLLSLPSPGSLWRLQRGAVHHALAVAALAAVCLILVHLAAAVATSARAALALNAMPGSAAAAAAAAGDGAALLLVHPSGSGPSSGTGADASAGASRVGAAVRGAGRWASTAAAVSIIALRSSVATPWSIPTAVAVVAAAVAVLVSSLVAVMALADVKSLFGPVLAPTQPRRIAVTALFVVSVAAQVVGILLAAAAGGVLLPSAFIPAPASVSASAAAAAAGAGDAATAAAEAAAAAREWLHRPWSAPLPSLHDAQGPTGGLPLRMAMAVKLLGVLAIVEAGIMAVAVLVLLPPRSAAVACADDPLLEAVANAAAAADDSGFGAAHSVSSSSSDANAANAAAVEAGMLGAADAHARLGIMAQSVLTTPRALAGLLRMWDLFPEQATTVDAYALLTSPAGAAAAAAAAASAAKGWSTAAAGQEWLLLLLELGTAAGGMGVVAQAACPHRTAIASRLASDASSSAPQWAGPVLPAPSRYALARLRLRGILCCLPSTLKCFVPLLCCGLVAAGDASARARAHAHAHAHAKWLGTPAGAGAVGGKEEDDSDLFDDLDGDVGAGGGVGLNPFSGLPEASAPLGPRVSKAMRGVDKGGDANGGGEDEEEDDAAVSSSGINGAARPAASAPAAPSRAGGYLGVGVCNACRRAAAAAAYARAISLFPATDQPLAIALGALGSVSPAAAAAAAAAAARAAGASTGSGAGMGAGRRREGPAAQLKAAAAGALCTLAAEVAGLRRAHGARASGRRGAAGRLGKGSSGAFSAAAVTSATGTGEDEAPWRVLAASRAAAAAAAASAASAPAPVATTAAASPGAGDGEDAISPWADIDDDVASSLDTALIAGSPSATDTASAAAASAAGTRSGAGAGVGAGAGPSASASGSASTRAKMRAGGFLREDDDGGYGSFAPPSGPGHLLVAAATSATAAPADASAYEYEPSVSRTRGVADPLAHLPRHAYPAAATAVSGAGAGAGVGGLLMEDIDDDTDPVADAEEARAAFGVVRGAVAK